MKSLDSNEIVISAGEQKINEYVERIKNGESVESVMQGLPESFVRSINEKLRNSEEVSLGDIPPQFRGVSAEALKEIWANPENVPIMIDGNNKKREDEIRRRQKIVDKLTESENKFNIKPIEIKKDVEETQDLGALIANVTKGRKQIVVDLYNNLLQDIDNPESKKSLISGLFQDVYNSYRIAEYPADKNEEVVWENNLKNSRVEVRNENGWQYRGIMPLKGQETITRGSFNVQVTQQLIDSLDQMILDGKLKANYKFGEPNNATSPNERHDSITIYFLEEPKQEIIEELSTLVKPYVRGDHLLGKKVSEGFFLSEIGSVKTEHIVSFIDKLKDIDRDFAEAIRIRTTPRIDKGTALKMSEAEFYAIKDVAKVFGYNINYNNEKGFTVSL